MPGKLKVLLGLDRELLLGFDWDSADPTWGITASEGAQYGTFLTTCQTKIELKKAEPPGSTFCVGNTTKYKGDKHLQFL